MYMYMTDTNYLGDVCELHKLYRIGRNYEENYIVMAKAEFTNIPTIN